MAPASVPVGSSPPPQRAAPRGTTHQVLLTLMDCGLSWSEARAIGIEEALCLLHHHGYRERLRALDAEAARIASLPFADPAAQQRELHRIRLRMRGVEEKFWKSL